MKKNDFNLAVLYSIFGALLVCANCIASKQVPIGRWFGCDVAITAGIVCYPLTFLITDVIGEVWGKKEASRAVVGGLIGQVVAIALVTLANVLKCNDSAMSVSFNSVLGSNWILTIGSLVACFASQSWDVWVFHRIREWYVKKNGSTKGGRWLWNNASTITSQLIDSVVFYIGLLIMLKTQGVILPFGVVCATIGAYWIVKIIIALCDTPFFYLLTNGGKRDEER